MFENGWYSNLACVHVMQIQTSTLRLLYLYVVFLITAGGRRALLVCNNAY